MSLQTWLNGDEKINDSVVSSITKEVSQKQQIQVFAKHSEYTKKMDIKNYATWFARFIELANRLDLETLFGLKRIEEPSILVFLLYPYLAQHGRARLEKACSEIKESSILEQKLDQWQYYSRIDRDEPWFLKECEEQVVAGDQLIRDVIYKRFKEMFLATSGKERQFFGCFASQLTTQEINDASFTHSELIHLQDEVRENYMRRQGMERVLRWIMPFGNNNHQMILTKSALNICFKELSKAKTENKSLLAELKKIVHSSQEWWSRHAKSPAYWYGVRHYQGDSMFNGWTVCKELSDMFEQMDKM